MARRRKATRRRSSFGGRVRRVASRKTGSKIISTVKPMASGVGGGMITEAAVSAVAPQYAQVASYGGAYLFGGIKGIAGKVIFDVITKGGIGGLGLGSSKPTEATI